MQSCISSLLSGDHLVSCDVSDDFYCIRIRPEHRKYFRFNVKSVVYEQTVLPSGMQPSPRVWTKFMRPVVTALCWMRFTVKAYVDDFASTGDGPRPSTAVSATAGCV